MEQKQITATYAEAVKAIKEAILESRYRVARLVNKEVLALYYAIGGYISVHGSLGDRYLSYGSLIPKHLSLRLCWKIFIFAVLIFSKSQ